MRKCQECGTEFSEYLSFCPICGKDFSRNNQVNTNMNKNVNNQESKTNILNESKKEDKQNSVDNKSNGNTYDQNLKFVRKPYDARKGLRFSMDVLITIATITTIIYLASAVIELIASIICLTDDTTRTIGIQLLIFAFVIIIYGAFRLCVIYRYKNSAYKFSIADVVLTMFISFPCAILMMINKGYD